MQDGGRRGALVSETHESARHTNMPEVAVSADYEKIRDENIARFLAVP